MAKLTAIPQRSNRGIATQQQVQRYPKKQLGNAIFPTSDALTLSIRQFDLERKYIGTTVAKAENPIEENVLLKIADKLKVEIPNLPYKEDILVDVARQVETRLLLSDYSISEKGIHTTNEECVEIFISAWELADVKPLVQRQLLFLFAMLKDCGFITNYDELEFYEDFPNISKDEDEEAYEYELEMKNEWENLKVEISLLDHRIYKARKYKIDIKKLRSRCDGMGLFADIIAYLHKKNFHPANYMDPNDDNDYSRYPFDRCFRINVGLEGHLYDDFQMYGQEGLQEVKLEKLYKPNGKLTTKADLLYLADLLCFFDITTQKFEIHDASESRLQAIQSLVRLHLNREISFVHRRERSDRERNSRSTKAFTKVSTFEIGPHHRNR